MIYGQTRRIPLREHPVPERVCGLPARALYSHCRAVMNSPVGTTEARDRIHTAPRLADHDAPCSESDRRVIVDGGTARNRHCAYSAMPSLTTSTVSTAASCSAQAGMAFSLEHFT